MKSHRYGTRLATPGKKCISISTFLRGTKVSEASDFILKTADAAVAVDREQRIVFWNTGAEELFGHKAEEVRGQYCYEVIGGLDDSGCDVCRAQCFAMTSALQGDLVPARDLLILTNGTRETWASVSTMVAPARWQNQFALVHMFRDISYHKNLEGFIRQLRSSLAGICVQNRGVDAPPGNNLSTREREVLALLASGASTKAISEKLFISPLTARNHIRNVFAKLGVNSRLGAVLAAYKRFGPGPNGS